MEPPGGLLGASWSVLRRSWGGLGASWAPLEPSQRRPEHHKDSIPKKGQLPDPEPSTPQRLEAPKKEAKIDQNRTQDELNFKTNFKSEKVALQEPLGAVLGHFGGHLGLKNSVPVVELVVFGEQSRF